MTAYVVSVVAVILAVIVIAALVYAARLAPRRREFVRDSLTPERLENLELFVR